MGTPTLFGDSDAIAGPAHVPAPEAVTRELVARGVPEHKARGYGSKQAFAVLNRMRKGVRQPAPHARAGAAPGKAGQDGPEADTGQDAPAPEERRPAVPQWPPVMRAALAADLAEIHADQGTPHEALCRSLVACLYPLTAAELDRVVAAVLAELGT